MEQQTQSVSMADKDKLLIRRSLGVVSASLSILVIMGWSMQGFQVEFFWDSLLALIVSLMISFVCFSKWKKVNALLLSVMFFGWAIWMTDELFNPTIIVIWVIGSYIAGLFYLLRFFNYEFSHVSQGLYRFFQTKAVRLILKIIFWVVLIAIGLLVLTGLFTWLAGLSATTIIIILLVLILLK